MPTFKPKTAEANFREAFERLKAGVPKVLPSGTLVSQNNVAKEAGCDPSALRKARFPGLVEEIQAFLATHDQERPSSERQRLLKARQVSRSKSETITNLKAQRDDAVSRLVEADELIGTLTQRVRDLEARLEDLQPRARIMPMPPFAKPKC
jgi:chromosome segregation ATPase